MAERQPIPIPEPKHAPPEGSRGIPPTLNERAKPPPESRAYPTLPQKSALNRAVERTRTPYERNGWVFLPFSEAGRPSPSLSNQPPPSEDFYQRLRERLRQVPQEEEMSELARENEEFIEELRRINPEGRQRKEKELLDFLFRRSPQKPEEEK